VDSKFVELTGLTVVVVVLAVAVRTGTKRIHSCALVFSLPAVVAFSLCFICSCTRMKPDWDRLSEESHPSVFIADVDCSDEEELCQEVGVQGYPTIKVYRDGKEEDYDGSRSFEELFEFVDGELAMKCDVNKMKESGCSEKAETYALKWKGKTEAEVKKETGRLSGMAGKSMTSDLKTWLRERLALLKQIAPASEEL
jgi:thioredoxin-like negative regulator of GroEL